ncbi:PTS cellobiose transporter subunit IIC [Terribacillus saccharophilus]|uniref:Permease IIC component n=1 Tax=Terribacillus saccharophilus TaxID=361277 RepID=A0A268AFG2_9BACI|nr:PTS cellobiose transporter subunit IIC [Terribacillus saccharophilus]PAD22864.1 PTS system, cellobiose-specific IIC component [Terribacillus saccharophilus]PAF17905.1 PTS system, cellobiose-specific IIC component [Terribacillus saccharophilus]PAF22819.1 PTS system, cellobiose-specific IIC component [Terribacillus saccharophilus]PAF37443.1 PTS system, cellobiose-specific IIC component [Terribacillus saccharophilus]PAF37745.1 PTS system, cellobiose-specific IIC component [Terribacillus saccha
MGSKFTETLENILLPIADKLNNNRYLGALRDGFMVALPFIIFGSLFVVLANIPFLDKIISENALAEYQSILGPASASTLSIMGLFVIFGIAYKLTQQYELEALYGGFAALASFIILTPQVLEGVAGVIPASALGAQGLFLGIFTAFVSVELYRFFVKKNWTIKMPQGVPEAVSKSFSSLIPLTLTLTFFLAIRAILSYTPYETLQNFIYTLIQQPLTSLGSGLVATIIAVLLIQVFWFFGLHGQIIVNSIMDPIWMTLSLENLEAFNAGLERPNIVNNQFIDTFIVGMGGTGMTMAVILGIFLFTKSRQLKNLGKLGGPAAIFNVNEPLIFGLPIVMNPMVIIPWLLSPVVVTIVTYFAMSTGLVPVSTGVHVPWTTPIFISGMLVTNSIAGAIMQLVNLVIVVLIWLPFLRILDKQYFRTEQTTTKDQKQGRDDKIV